MTSCDSNSRCSSINTFLIPVQGQDGRLPLDISPIHYNLEFTPDVYTGSPPFLFSGSVELHFRANSETLNIVLNSADLAIDEDGIELSVHPDSPEPAEDPVLSAVEEDPGMNFYTLTLQVHHNSSYLTSLFTSYITISTGIRTIVLIFHRRK